MSKRKKIQNLVNRPYFLLNQNLTTFKEIYKNIANNNGHDLAFIHHEYSGDIKEYQYSQYARLCESVARKLSVLLADKKIKDAVVGLKVGNSPAWCFLFWGLLMSGYRPLLIDAKLAKENTQLLLKSAKAIAIITDDQNTYDNITTLSRDDVNDISEDLNFTPNWADEIIFCSSGTTGDIKLMVFDGNNMMNQLNASRKMPNETLDIIYPQKKNSRLRIIGLIPFHHIFAFVSIFLWYSFYGETIVFTDFNDPVTLIKEIHDLKITHLFHVPLFYEVVAKNFMHQVSTNQRYKDAVDRLIKYNLGQIRRKEAGFGIGTVQKIVKRVLFGPQIRFLISGGGYLSEDTSKIINGLGYPLYNGYGMTEIGVTSVELSPYIADRLKRSIGRPLNKISYKLNRQNELLVKSDIVHIKEIINGKEKPTTFERDGYFATGDIAKVDKDGRYYLIGRSKEVIITSNGENVYPEEIESYFKRVKGVDNLAAFEAKKKIILVIETSSDKIAQEINNINASLPLHKQANKIVLTKESLPLSSSLKVKRYLVKENYLKNVYKSSDFTKKKVDVLAGYDKTARNNVVRRLNLVFKEVLFVEKDIDGNAHWINDLHSDSMTYITLINAIEKEFAVKIPLEKYGQLTTLNEFAKQLLDSGCK
ncbi:MAG: AMP-binding protein [Bacilli bacterium]|nr:AMP-binding protein [Bacilli bacterium]